MIGDGHVDTAVLGAVQVSDSSPKILRECALPLTGERCVHRVLTDLGVTVVDITARTGAPLCLDSLTIALLNCEAHRLPAAGARV